MKILIVLIILGLFKVSYATNFITNDKTNVGISSSSPTDLLCVDGGDVKITNGHVASDSVNLIYFSSACTGAGFGFATTNQWYSAEGTTVTITVTVPSWAIVYYDFDFSIGTNFNDVLVGNIVLDSAVYLGNCIYSGYTNSRLTVSNSCLTKLTTGKHTMCMVAQTLFGSASAGVNSSHTNYTIFVFKQ